VSVTFKFGIDFDSYGYRLIFSVENDIVPPRSQSYDYKN